MMRNGFGIYSLGWMVVLALYNLVTFITPSEVNGNTKYTTMFWISYVFVTLLFIVQLGCAYFVFQATNAKKMLYRISLVKISAGALIIMFIVSTICTSVIQVPDWIGIIVCAVVLAINIVALIKAYMATDAVEEIDYKIREKTRFIKVLTAEAEALMNSSASNDDVSVATKKVYEAIRYSDPVSHPSLAVLEDKISDMFVKFSFAVSHGNVADVDGLADEIASVVAERNAKCKVLK